MFANACRTAAAFTRPVVISRVAADGSCSSSIGSYVVINDEGWIATAWHIVELFQKLSTSKAAYRTYEDRVVAIQNDSTLNKNGRGRAIRALGNRDKNWTKDYSFWWAYDGVSIVDVKGQTDSDLAIGRLQPFDKTWVPQYPLIKDPAQPIVPGTSLCKLGFPAKPSSRDT